MRLSLSDIEPESPSFYRNDLGPVHHFYVTGR